MAKVVYAKSSVYALTPQTSTYLGYWEPPSVVPSVTDRLITLSEKYRHRPDLLSADLYGTPRLWWVFAVINPNIITDPIYSMKPGMELYVPIASSVQGYL